MNDGAKGIEKDALFFMAGAVLGYSLTPLVVVLAGGDSPFLFNAGWRLGLVIGFMTFAWAKYRDVLRIPSVTSDIRNALKSPAILATAISNFDYALFVLATMVIHVTAATVIFETWPLWMILMLALAYRGEDRYQKTVLFTVAMIGMCVVGLYLVIGSQSGTLSYLSQGGAVEMTLLGGGFALAGALITSLAAFSFRWSTNLSRKLSKKEEVRKVYPQPSEDGTLEKLLELLCLLIAYGVSSVIAISVSLIIGIARGETTSLNAQLIAILGGILTYAPATIAWRLGNLRSSNLGINVMIYWTPVVSLFWLYLLSIGIVWQVQSLFKFSILRADYLVIGSLFIVVANLLINFEAEIRLGLKALIVALLLFGTAVYFREEFVTFLGIAEWHWEGDDYFEAIALAATVFTLILAFRVARLVTRTNNEEARIYSLFRKMEALVRHNVINTGVVESILKLNNPGVGQTESREIYSEIRTHIANSYKGPENISGSDQEMLTQAEADLDVLARSKQTDIVLGEIFALIIFAGIVVALAMFTRPKDLNDWTRWMVDVFAMLISSVIVFLVSDVRDLHRERSEPKLEPVAGGESYRIWYRDTEGRFPDQLISGLVGGVIVLSFLGLLMNKWIGLF